MSVCIAWKYGDKICLAADSRFTGGDLPIDFGIKVLECPIRIISAVDDATGDYKVWHDSAVGLAFSGSQLAGYLIKERIAELLLKLQYIGPGSSITFAKIVDAAFKVYQHAIGGINHAYGGYGHDADFFMVGGAPADGGPSAYRFSTEEYSGQSVCVPILMDEHFGYEAIGAGSERLLNRIAARLDQSPCAVHFMVLEELREMILRDEVPSVGGSVQYGEIEGLAPFSIYGVVDFRLRDNEIIPMPPSRGIDIEEIVAPRNPDDLFVRESMITPFQHILNRSV